MSYLIIENLGQSVARNVEITFDPPLPDYETSANGRPGVVAPFLRKRYSHPLTMVAPGQRLKNIYSYIASGVEGNVEPVPDQFTVTVRYSDDHGKKYKDSFSLDRELLGLETKTSPGSGNDPVLRKNKALEAIAWELWK